MSDDILLREQLIKNLHSESHMPFGESVKDFPQKHYNTFAPHVDYTFWHLLEHIRITQWDIYDFSINPKYKYIKWPDAYWPKKNAKATKAQWDKTVKEIERDLKAMMKLVKNSKTDLYKKIPWGEGQTILREAIMVADHNAYHIGEFAILRQVLGTWPKSHN